MSFLGTWSHFGKMLTSWSATASAAAVLAGCFSADECICPPSLAEELRLAKSDIYLSISFANTLLDMLLLSMYLISSVWIFCFCDISWYGFGSGVGDGWHWMVSDSHVFKMGAHRLKWIRANTKGVCMDCAQCLNENHGTHVIDAQYQSEQQHAT